jgi:dimethylargininase
VSPTPFAVVREIPDAFVHAITAHPPRPPLDVARARAQHASYVAALAGLGLELVRIAADEACPDCCFVEDTALFADGIALLTRPGAPSRRAETAAVRAALAGRCELHEMVAPATLDGGDVLRLGTTFFVGRSARTNAEGVARLRELFAPRGHRVVEIPVDRVLHLKSACSPLGDDTVLVAEGLLHGAWFGPARLLVAPAEEAFAANAVAHRGRALVAAGAPRTRALIEQAGFATVEVDASELRRADGALTCLSIICDASGSIAA